jgi:hypothetical protein
LDYSSGCEQILQGLLNSSLETIALAGVLVGVLEFFGAIFSIILSRNVTEREQVQSSLLNEAWRVNRTKVNYG